MKKVLLSTNSAIEGIQKTQIIIIMPLPTCTMKMLCSLISATDLIFLKLGLDGFGHH